MIGVFVGDEDAVQSFGRASERGQPLADLPATKAGIDEHAGLLGFQIGTVAGRTAAQDSQANRHGPEAKGAQTAGQSFSGSRPTWGRTWTLPPERTTPDRALRQSVHDGARSGVVRSRCRFVGRGSVQMRPPPG